MNDEEQQVNNNNNNNNNKQQLETNEVAAAAAATPPSLPATLLSEKPKRRSTLKHLNFSKQHLYNTCYIANCDCRLSSSNKHTKTPTLAIKQEPHVVTEIDSYDSVTIKKEPVNLVFRPRIDANDIEHEHIENELPTKTIKSKRQQQQKAPSNNKTNQQQQQQLVNESQILNSEFLVANLSKFLEKPKSESTILISDLIKIEQLKVDSIRDYLKRSQTNVIDFNNFIKESTTKKFNFAKRKRPPQSSSQSQSQSQKTANRRQSRVNSRKIIFKNVSNKISSREKTTTSTSTTNETQSVSFKDNGKKKISCVISGKHVVIDEEDYRFIKYGKWCASEFFRYETTNIENECEFCKAKCKTTIDNVYICILCRNFALKTLVKHLHYVCKDRFITPDICKLPKHITDFSRSKYCRFCYFYVIFHKLPRLTRLEKYIVEFKNKTLRFLNSGPTKKERLMNRQKQRRSSQSHNNSSSSNNNRRRQQSSDEDEEDNEGEDDDDENDEDEDECENDDEDYNCEDDDYQNDENSSDNENYTDYQTHKTQIESDECDGLLNIENDYDDIYNCFDVMPSTSTSTTTITTSSTNQRSGPRVKHVSRKEPVELSRSLLLLDQLRNNETNCVNNDNHFNLKTYMNYELRLSALPDGVKNALIKRIRYKNFIENSNMNAEIILQNKQSTNIKIFRRKQELSNYFNGDEDDDKNNEKPSRTTSASNSTSNSHHMRMTSSRKTKCDDSGLDEPSDNVTDKNVIEQRKKKKVKSSCSIDMNEQFQIRDWDDFFERFHKISTNQNYRFAKPTNTQQQQQTTTNDKTSATTEDGINLNVQSTDTETIPIQMSNNHKSERLKFKVLTQNISKIDHHHHNKSISQNNSTNSNISNGIVSNNLYKQQQQQQQQQQYFNNNSNLLVWDMKPDYDIYEIWKHGFPVVNGKQICLKSACYLCGTVGLDTSQLLYCNVCCEPFHTYCLEVYELPKENTHILNWICPACKFCEICGLQNDLLHCEKCENCYHAQCFKKINYPKKPTKKNHFWICYNCFECKSCGSKNMNYDVKLYLKMGDYDFSLCFNCDKQIQTGDFCRVCKFAYNKTMLDSSIESAKKNKMIKCSICYNWVHYKCENVTDEDYDMMIDSNCTFNYQCQFCTPNYQYKQALVDYINKTLKTILNELKENLNTIVDETVDLDLLFKDLIDKTNTNSYGKLKLFWDDFMNIKDERFDNNLLELIKNGLLELIKERFKQFNPNETSQQETVSTTASSSSSEPTVTTTTNTTETETEGQTTLTTSSTPTKTTKKSKTKKTNNQQPQQQQSSSSPSSSLSTVTTQLTKTKNENTKKKSNQHSIFNNFNQIYVKIPYEDHTYAKSAAPMPSYQQILIGKASVEKCTLKEWFNYYSLTDTRKCCLCNKYGDDQYCGRLMSLDSIWIHMNCALWSQDVYNNEHIIEQIQTAIVKIKSSICKYCRKEGATIQCKYKNCELNYHFSCALDTKCILTVEHELYCKEHFENDENQEQLNNLNKLNDYQLKQCLIIDIDNYRKKYSPQILNINSVFILIGSMQIISLGDIDSISDSEDIIYPIDYCCSRVYWSAFEIGKKVTYKCRIKRVCATDRKLSCEKTIANDGDDCSCHDGESLLSESKIKNEFMDAKPAAQNGFYDLLQTDGNNDYFIDDDNVVTTGLHQQPNASTASATTSAAASAIVNQKSSSIEKLLINNKANQLFKILPNPSQTATTTATTTSYPSSPSSPVYRYNLTEYEGSTKPKIVKLTTTNLNQHQQQQQIVQFRFDKSGIRNESLIQPQTTIFTQNTNNNNSNELNINTTNSYSFNNIGIGGISSPKSDKSDSSLNLDNISNILNNNPLTSFQTEDENAHLYNNNQNNANNSYLFNNNLTISQNQNANKIKIINKQHQLSQNRIRNSELSSDYHKFNSSYEKLNKKLTSIQQSPNTNNATNQIQNKEAIITKCKSRSHNEHNKTIKQLLDDQDRIKSLIQQHQQQQQQPQTPQITQPQTPQITQQQQEQQQLLQQQLQQNQIEQEQQPEIEKPLTLKEEPSPPPSNHHSTESIPPTPSPPESPAVQPLKEQNNKKPSKKANNRQQQKPEQPSIKQKRKLSATNRPTKTTTNNTNSETKTTNDSNENEIDYIGILRQKEIDNFNKENKLNMDRLSENQLYFEIVSEEGFIIQTIDINDAWKKLTDLVDKLRKIYNLKQLSYQGINGLTMYGLNNKTVSYLIEQQFDSIQYCKLYKNKYIPRRVTDEKWKINPDNCARISEQFDKTKKCRTDYFHWLTSNLRVNDYYLTNHNFDDTFWNSRKALLSSEMSNAMKYRHLKNFSKRGLVVKLSQIHGRGLFTLVDIEQGQMIIEYAGEVIRNQLCDKREKYYEAKGIGCYMFRIDEQEVIDATRKGNQARFINHSCEPNCLSKVLMVQGQKHIIIFAQRFIHKGEELTYDYKFPKEDIKIQCLCKSVKCRKYLN